MIDNPRETLLLAGASPADIAWFEELGWRDDKIPPVSQVSLHDYERREALLNKSLETLTTAERATSKAGHLAAALGARIADFRDGAEEDDEG